MILYTDEAIQFEVGEFYTVQQMLGLPDLPPGKVAVSAGYNIVAVGTPPVDGSVNFQYLENNVLLAKVEETELAIHFWNPATQQWQVLETLIDPFFNMAVARSEGLGIYALLAGTTVPQITMVSPVAATNNVQTTLLISGTAFLPPVQVTLVGPGQTYVLPLSKVTPVSPTAIVTAGLVAREYQVHVSNTNEPGGPASALTPGRFSLFEPQYASF
jgi:hypothetical protein